MKPQKYFRLALNILLHSKLRSWLTIIGIVIGVASMVAIVSIGEGAQQTVKERLSGLGADLITVSPGFERAAGGFRGGFGGGGGGGGGGVTSNGKNLTDHDIQSIKSVQDISFIDGIISGRATVSYLAETATVSVQGVDPLAWSNIITTELDSGRYLSPSDVNVVVIGNRLAASTFKQPLVVNRDIAVAGKPFKIVGVLKSSGGFGGDDNRIFMPVTEARNVLENTANKYDSIVVKAASSDAVDAVTADIESQLLLTRHLNNRTKDFTVTSSKQTQQTIQNITQTFTIFLGAIAAVSLLVGAVGIANTMFTSVLEKTKEIGVMKAIGARNFDIMAIFLLNSGLVGLVGGLIGVGLGAAISSQLPKLLAGIGPGAQGGIHTAVPINFVAFALVVSLLIGMAAGAIPAWRASKLKPVDALRYE